MRNEQDRRYDNDYDNRYERSGNYYGRSSQNRNSGDEGRYGERDHEHYGGYRGSSSRPDYGSDYGRSGYDSQYSGQGYRQRSGYQDQDYRYEDEGYRGSYGRSYDEKPAGGNRRSNQSMYGNNPGGVGARRQPSGRNYSAQHGGMDYDSRNDNRSDNYREGWYREDQYSRYQDDTRNDYGPRRQNSGQGFDQRNSSYSQDSGQRYGQRYGQGYGDDYGRGSGGYGYDRGYEEDDRRSYDRNFGDFDY